VSDQLMMRYYRLLTDVPEAELERMEEDMRAGKLNPRDAKVRLAKEFVKRFHGAEAAEAAEEEFNRIFVAKGVPDEMPEFKIPASRFSDEIDVAALLKDCLLVQSTSEARRLIQGGAVEMGGAKVREPKVKFDFKAGDE